MNISNVAAHSLQAGMTIKELVRLMETLGQAPSKDQLNEISVIRKQLRNTAKELR